MVVMSSSALFPLLYAPTTLEADEVVWLRYLWLPIYGATALLLAWRWREALRAALAFGPAAVLLAFAAASAAWSIAPDVTVRRVEALAFNDLMALYLACRFAWRDLLRIVSAAFLVLAAGSWVMCLAFPALGVHHLVNAGDWRGLWTEKNEMGFLMVTGTMAALACAFIDARLRGLWLAGALACMGLAIMSRSGTSLICLLAGGGAAIGLQASKGRPVAGVAIAFLAGCAVVALVVLLLADLPLLFTLMGKDPTLTGRTGVWTAVLRRIAERPHLGYGYGAFWHDRFGPAMLIRRETHWDVPAAHNGWLEIVLQIGEIGVGLVALYFALTVGALLKRLFVRGDGFWAVMYIGAFVVLSLSESVILRQNSLEWILFVATATKLAMEIKAPRRRPSPARARLALVPPLQQLRR
jgi:O-antigen ligase